MPTTFQIELATIVWLSSDWKHKFLLICCRCGKRISKPCRKLENSVFVVELYKCRKCRQTYKEAHYNFRIFEDEVIGVIS